MNENDIKRAYEKVFNEYWVNDSDRGVVNTVQAGVSRLFFIFINNI